MNPGDHSNGRPAPLTRDDCAFWLDRRPGRVARHGAWFRARADRPARAGMGPDASSAPARPAPGRRAWDGRDLLPRGIRRLWPWAARRGDHFRSAGHRLSGDFGVPVDPQHGHLDDRPLRQCRATGAPHSGHGTDGFNRRLLPDRAWIGLGRRRACAAGRCAMATPTCSTASSNSFQVQAWPTSTW